MKAMVFAAGLGTRLRPLTEERPKALVDVGGRPLLEIVLRRLQHYGFETVVVNVHHFAEQVKAFLDGLDLGLDLHLSDESDLLLDTGGGLLRAAPLLADGPFLVHNVDILTDLDLAALYHAHVNEAALATLAVRRRPSSRQLLFNEDYVLCGWQNTRTGEERYCRRGEIVNPWAFSGVYVLSPGIFDYMPADQPVFSIIDTFLTAGAAEPIYAYPHDQDQWLDVGRPEALERAVELVRSLPGLSGAPDQD